MSNSSKSRTFTGLIKLIFLKAVYVSIRYLTKGLYQKHQFATTLYGWADNNFYKTCKGIYVLPEWLWRLIAATLNYIAGINTVDHNKLRFKRLQKIIDDALHRVPDVYRFPKMRPFNAETIGQDGE